MWNPWLIQDIKCVERVQCFFTRAIFIQVKLPTMSYTNRHANLGLHSLEYRRVYYDLVMCFKIVKNLVDLDASAFFRINLSPYSTRGNSIKLSPLSLPHHNFYSNFFSIRVIHIWNSLPDSVATASSEKIFRSNLSNLDLSPFCKCYPF